MNSDFRDLLQLLYEEQVEYLVVGGYAVIYHAQPRSTKDLDIWVKPSVENAQKVGRVFQKFGMPLIDVTLEDFSNEGLQYAIGMPPTMIDFLTSIPGLNFEQCWNNRVTAKHEDLNILFLSKEDLITAKQTAGRPQDLADIDELRKA